MKEFLNKQKLTLSLLLLFFFSNLSAQTLGCTDASADNFNPEATVNNGSCTYITASVSPSTTWLLPEVIQETSGLILWNDKVWTHNDDTDINLYALDTSDISNYSALSLTNCVNKDWEDIAQDDNYIYIGDFGNNVSGNRTDLKILRVEKNSLLENNPMIDTIHFSYSLQTDFSPTESNQTNFDCEAFIVSTDSIYLFTKEWLDKGSAIYSLPKSPGTYSANYISNYDVNGLITGATYLEEERLIALSGYSIMLEPFIYLLYDFQPFDFFSGNKRKISLDLPFTQAEGIATADGLHYFVSNETFTGGNINSPAKLNLFNLSSFLTNYLVLNTPNFELIDNVKIYPNPVTDVLTINWGNTNFSTVEISIYNAIGQVVYSKETNLEMEQIDVNNYTPGIYYVTFSSEAKHIKRKKFTKL